MLRGLLRLGRNRPFIWEGVYAHYRDVPAKGAGFDGEAWISETTRFTANAWQAFRNTKQEIPRDIPSHHLVFAQTVAGLGLHRRSFRVLDFGGGMGASYVNLRRCLEEPPEMEYWVVDNERSCKTGVQLASGDPLLRFSAGLPEIAGKLDIALLSGVLQFVEDYRAVLTAVASYRPESWLFTFLPAGHGIPTFASAQKNVPGSIIPVWFFNIGHLIEILRPLNYRLAFSSVLERQFDMSNFPASHRLARQCNLLFRRVD